MYCKGRRISSYTKPAATMAMEKVNMATLGTGVVSFVDAKFITCDNPIYISSVYPCSLVYRMNLRIAEGKKKKNSPGNF